MIFSFFIIFVTLCLTILVFRGVKYLKTYFSHISLVILLSERLTCLHMLFFSLRSSRNVTPCTKVMFQ
uniref:Uncharacterized protein n=1 Tax=Arundo donax TaxID=35708 RepID=A0A0A9DIB8_ARUDO